LYWMRWNFCTSSGNWIPYYRFML